MQHRQALAIHALHAIAQVLHKAVVAQIIKAKFAAGAIGNIALVGLGTFNRAQVQEAFVLNRRSWVIGIARIIRSPGLATGLNNAGAHAQRVIHASHPLRIALHQIIVLGDEVCTQPTQGIEIQRRSGDQGLALTCAQLGNFALVQQGPADQLHIVVAHIIGAAAGLAHGGKGFRQQVVQRLALGHARAELRCLAAQVIVAQLHKVGFQRVNAFHHRINARQRFIAIAADEFG